jgi:hypothetical protein
MPIYFPRNKSEEDYVLTVMPKDIGKSEELRVPKGLVGKFIELYSFRKLASVL